MSTITDNDSNTAIGHHALKVCESGGNRNVAVGSFALDAMTTGTDSVAVGDFSLSGNTTGVRNTALGRNSLLAPDTENDNVALGFATLAGAIAGGEKNVAVGSYALDALTSGDENISIGHISGTALTTASKCTLIGVQAGTAITTGGDNIAIGYGAMDGFDTETHNLGIGRSALGGAVAGGEYNVAVGNTCFDGLTSGDYDTALGYGAGGALTTGSQSTFLGARSGASVTTGTGNTIIGDSSAAALQDGNNNTIIGVAVNCNSDHTNGIALGQGISVGGDYDFSFGSASNVVTNDFNADADWSRSSDIRLKRNIQDSTLGLDFINDLRPVKFQWKPSYEVPKELASEYNEENKKNLDVIMHGFIAQEVKEAIDKHGDTTFGGWHLDSFDGVTQRTKKNMFVMPLIKAVQELSAQVTTLKDEINTLKGG